MRTWMIWLGVVTIVSLASFLVYSLSQGQEQSRPTTVAVPAVAAPRAEAATERPVRDVSKLPPLQQQMYLSAQRGAEWLVRGNRPDGRFFNGVLPALQKVVEGDHYVRQVGAVLALARVARLTGEERYAAIARQALLTLLLDTVVDPQDPNVRMTTMPSAAVNRLASAGLLVAAIYELPAPGSDLVAPADVSRRRLERSPADPR